MMTDAATNSPSSVRRRALKDRRMAFDSGSSRAVADITASLPAGDSQAGEPPDRPGGTMTRR